MRTTAFKRDRGAGFGVKGGKKRTIKRERNYGTRPSAQIAPGLGALSDTERFEFGLVLVNIFYTEDGKIYRAKKPRQGVLANTLNLFRNGASPLANVFGVCSSIG